LLIWLLENGPPAFLLLIVSSSTSPVLTSPLAACSNIVIPKGFFPLQDNSLFIQRFRRRGPQSSPYAAMAERQHNWRVGLPMTAPSISLCVVHRRRRHQQAHAQHRPLLIKSYNRTKLRTLPTWPTVYAASLKTPRPRDGDHALYASVQDLTPRGTVIRTHTSIHPSGCRFRRNSPTCTPNLVDQRAGPP